MTKIERDGPDHEYSEYLAEPERAAGEHERTAAREALREAEARLAAEREAHEATRRAHARVQEQLSRVSAELDDVRRETAIRGAASAARARELDDRRRELQVERTAHAGTREALVRAEAARVALVEAAAGLQARLERAAPDLEAMRARLAEAEAQRAALQGEWTVARERLEGAELALRDEVRAHAETRRRLQDALERPRVDGLLGRLGRLRIVRALLERIGVDEPTARRD